MSITTKCINGVCVCILPTPDNGHRPLFLRHGSLALVSAVLIVLKIFTAATLAFTPATAQLSTITSARIVQLTNNERVKQGQQTLNVNPLLTQAAQEKGQHMLKEGYFAHISPSGVTPWFWINKAGYTYTIAGENLAIDFSQAEDVVAAWIASPTHRDNMLHTDYTETGVAVVTGEFQGNTSTIVVHMFGKPTIQETPPPLPDSTLPPADDPPVIPPPSLAPAPPTKTTPPPAPEPVIPTPDTPSIALNGNNQARHEITLLITGAPNSQVQLIVNDEKTELVTLNGRGALRYALDISDLPDGQIQIKGYAFNHEGGQSGFSENVDVIKKTNGPEVNKEDIVMILSPGTDRPNLAMRVQSNSFHSLLLPNKNPLVAAEQDFSWLALAQNGEHNINLIFSDDLGNNTEISLSTSPKFSTDRTPAYTQKSAQLTSITRSISLAIFLSIVILLSLSIVIRINIQHPGLIAHSIFVILLASLMLLF